MKPFLLSVLAIGLFSTQLAFGAVEIGQKAPDFTLTNHEGKSTSLNEFADKIVVLEWYNEGCPFVRKHYDPKNMQALQKTYGDKEVVWLTIASSAQGKQGHVEQARAKELMKKEGTNARMMLLDHDGVVGRAYDAKTTPHMYVINNGTLVYQGAIDSIASANAADISKADNYVTMALESVMKGEAVAVAKTKPYGCSVKF